MGDVVHSRLELLNGALSARSSSRAATIREEEPCRSSSRPRGGFGESSARGLHYAHELSDSFLFSRTGTFQLLADSPATSTEATIHRFTERTVKSDSISVGGGERRRNRQTEERGKASSRKIPVPLPEAGHDSARSIAEGTPSTRSAQTLWELTTMKRLFKRDTTSIRFRAIEKGRDPRPAETSSRLSAASFGASWKTARF